MVKIVVQASDPTDNFTRDWLIAVDQVPIAPAWEQSSDTEVHHSGDTMSKDVTLSDGKHKVYFVVSQSGGPNYGTYSGDISLDTKTAKFNGVNVNSPAGFTIDVKNNEVVSETSSAANGSTQDKVIAWLTKNWKMVSIGIGSVIGIGVGAKVASSNGNRRRL